MITKLHSPDPERSGKEKIWGLVWIFLRRRNGDRSGKDLTGGRAGGRGEAAGIGGHLGVT